MGGLNLNGILKPGGTRWKAFKRSAVSWSKWSISWPGTAWFSDVKLLVLYLNYNFSFRKSLQITNRNSCIGYVKKHCTLLWWFEFWATKFRPNGRILWGFLLKLNSLKLYSITHRSIKMSHLFMKFPTLKRQAKLSNYSNISEQVCMLYEWIFYFWIDGPFLLFVQKMSQIYIFGQMLSKLF